MLMSLMERYLKKNSKELLKAGVKLNTIGDIEKLPKKVQTELAKVKELTKNEKNLNLVLALNYGGRDEIKRATIKIIKDYIKH